MKRMMIGFVGVALFAVGCGGGGDESPDVTSAATSVTTATRVTPTTIAPTVRTPQDEAFLELLGGEVTLSDPAALQAGHQVCDRLDAGDTLNEAAIAITDAGSVVRKNAVLVAMAAPPTLCAQHLESARQQIIDGSVTGTS